MSSLLTFNARVYLPNTVLNRLPDGILQLNWSYHALQKAADRGFDEAPDALDLDQADIVEVSTDKNLQPVKLVCRVEADEERDMVLVIKKDRYGDFWTVKTCWSNDRDDHHHSLNTAYLVQPPAFVLA